MEVMRMNWKLSLILVLILATCVVWFIALSLQPVDYVTIAFLNVGQGDAIYIESPTGNQLLIDGGPPRKLLGELRKVVPFYDRTIDAILVTNPDQDHFAGFIDVLNMYKVDRVIEPGTQSSTTIYAEFSKEVDEERAQEILARRGMVIHLGSSTDLTILFPDRDVSNVKRNDGSVIARLTYGSTSVMFTGDAPSSTEEYALAISGQDAVRSDILKIGHHGSRTSASEEFIKAVNPKWAVISAGYKNRYGHPHKETIDMLDKLDISTLITHEEGTIVFRCDMKECVKTSEK